MKFLRWRVLIVAAALFVHVFCTPAAPQSAWRAPATPTNVRRLSPVRQVSGVTRTVQAPMVAESWEATLGQTSVAPHGLPWHIGYFPGYREAKRQANARRQAAEAGPSSDMPGSFAPIKMTDTYALATASDPGVVFDGPSESDTHEIPPDPQIAAGPNYVVVAVNSFLAIYDKSGNLQGSFQQLNSFFSSLGITGSIFDPRLIYDQTDQRFMLSAGEIDFTNLTNGHVLLAVSATSDPTGTWYKFAIDSKGQSVYDSNATFPDFPGLGLSQSAVYITTNQFEVTHTCLSTDPEACYFSDAWIKVIGLPELLSGNSSLNITAFTNIETADNFPAFAIQPAMTYGTAPAEFMVAAEFRANPSTLLNVFTITLSGTPTLSVANLAVPPFSIPPDARQPQNLLIATNDFRPLNAVWSNNALWFGQDVFEQSTGGAGVRWYELAASSLASIGVSQTGDVIGSGDAYFPALDLIANGDMGIVFSTSSVQEFASAAFTGRAASDAPNTVREYGLYRQGTAVYQDQALRWGDYSGMVPDPDGGSFWMIAEYAGSPNPHFGTAIAQANIPELALSATVLNFGAETLNVPSAPQTVSITNNGSAPLSLGSAAISGPNGSDFKISADTCSGATLAPAAACTIAVVFAPSVLGAKGAVLQVGTSPGLLLQQVLLTGQGVLASANLNVSPQSLDFGSVAVHTAAAPQAVIVTNTGSQPEALLIEMQNLYWFTQSNNCGTSLAAGSKCQISVVFHALGTALGAVTSGMNISYTGFPTGVAPISVSLTGTPADAPGVILCPNAVNFGNQTVGTTSAPQSITISNPGSISLTVNSITVSGSFSQTNNCGALPATILPGMACDVSVTFTPSSASTSTGALTITDNAPGSPQTATLTGNGLTGSAQLMLQPLGTDGMVDGSAVSISRSGKGRDNVASRSRTNPSDLRAALNRRLGSAASYGKLPIAFEANAGQTDPRAKFLSRGRGYTMFLTADGAVISLNGNRNQGRWSPRESRRQRKREHRMPGTADTSPLPGVVQLTLLGTNAAARGLGEDELPGRVNYFLGNDPAKWRTNIPRYAKVKYENIYPGISLVYYGHQGHLEFDFVVSPGADPGSIEFNIQSDPGAKTGHHAAKPAEPVRISADGDLVIATREGDLLFHKPVVYQDEPERGWQEPKLDNRPPKEEIRKYLDGSFVITAANRVAFQVGRFDPSEPLVIDPVLAYSTYLGGNDADEANAVILDTSGSAYVVGTTASVNFPVVNALQPAINRTVSTGTEATDAFITKLSPDGKSLVFSTYLGGSSGEFGNAVAVDALGNVYLAGETDSSDFPVTKGAFQTLNKSTAPFGGNGFITKLNPTGSALVYSTLFGGSGEDLITSLAVDSSGNAYIGGATSSPDLPATPGAIQTTFGVGQSGYCILEPNLAFGCGHGFVAEVNPQGTGLVYATYLGGSQADYVTGIAIDSTGAAYVTGSTASSDFPVTPGSFQTWLSAAGSGFVAKIKPQGTGLAYSTYLGPHAPNLNGFPQGGTAPSGIAIDSQGAAYVVGSTGSPNFPTVNPYQTKQITLEGSFQSGFVTKFHPAGCGLSYSTYLGGVSESAATGVAVDSSGDAYVTGWTGDLDFPTRNPFQASYRQASRSYAIPTEAFVTELAPSGSSLIYSSYLGGTTTDLPFGYAGGDFGNAIAIDSAGNAYVAGQTDSIDFPTVGAPDPTYGGKRDGFVTKIAPTVVPSITLNPPSVTFPDQALGTTSAPMTVTVTNPTSSPVNITNVSVRLEVYNSGFDISSNSCVTTLQPGASCSFAVTFTPPDTGVDPAVVNVDDNAFAGPHVVPLYGTGYTGPTVSITGQDLQSGILTFGAAPVGNKDLNSQLTLTNAGTQSLTINGISISGDFIETNNCPATLNGSQSCGITVNFAPKQGGIRTGTLTITDNASNSPQVVGLTGTGQDFSVGVAAGTSSSATINAGQNATYSLSVTPAGGFNFPVTFACTGAPSLATCTVSPSSVTLDGANPASAKVTVTTTAATASPPAAHRLLPPLGKHPRWPAACLLLLVTLMLALLMAGANRRRAWLGLAAILVIIGLSASCGGGGGGGGGGSPGTPAGTYTLTLTGTYAPGSTTLSHSVTLTLKVE